MTDFIHTGDIHLGSKFKTTSFGADKGRRRREELWSTFKRLITYAVDNQIRIFLIAGDLYEADFFTRRDMLRLSELLKTASDVKFIIVEGNHDMTPEHLQGWAWSENVKVLKGSSSTKVIFEEVGVAIHGIGWEKAMDTQSLLNSAVKVEGMYNILMLHGDALGNSNYMPISKNSLAELEMDYIALGHIHKPMFISENIAYCGSLEGLDFGEPGDRGFIHGRLGEKNTFEFIPFSDRRFHVIKFELKGDMTLSEIIDSVISKIKKGHADDFYRLILTGIAPMQFTKESLKNELEYECYHLEIIDETVPDFDLEELLEIHCDNIIGSFIRSFSEDELKEPAPRRALHLGLLALMEGGTQNVNQRA